MTDNSNVSPDLETTAGNEQTTDVNTTDPVKTTNLPTTNDDDHEPETGRKAKDRFSKTAVFNGVEFDYLDKVLLARQKAGLTRDWNHLLRQCVDFTINSRSPLKNGVQFATPDIKPVLLKNAFFSIEK